MWVKVAVKPVKPAGLALKYAVKYIVRLLGFLNKS